MNLGGFGEVIVYDDRDKDFIAGMNLMGGVSLQPIPIVVGLGVDHYAGKQKYEFSFPSPCSRVSHSVDSRICIIP